MSSNNISKSYLLNRVAELYSVIDDLLQKIESLEIELEKVQEENELLKIEFIY